MAKQHKKTSSSKKSKPQKQSATGIVLGAIIVVLIIIATAISLSLDSSSSTVAVLETNKGKIKIELFMKQTPKTASNFKSLVEQGFYDGTRFHRVIDNFMIQGGDPLSKNTSLQNRWGTGGPGYTIDDEFVKELSNVRGTISMANSGRPNSGGSQFFINVENNSFLDFNKEPASSRHPVFGKVVSGMDVVDTISQVEATEQANRPLEDIIITKAYIK